MALFVCTALILTVISLISETVSGDETGVGALTVMEKLRVPVLPCASVTVMVTVKFPACVGLPVIRPLEELILIPDGAPDIEYRYVPEPPDTET